MTENGANLNLKDTTRNLLENGKKIGLTNEDKTKYMVATRNNYKVEH